MRGREIWRSDRAVERGRVIRRKDARLLNKHAFLRFGHELVFILRNQKGKAGASKCFKKTIIRNFVKQFIIKRDVPKVMYRQPINEKCGSGESFHQKAWW